MRRFIEVCVVTFSCVALNLVVHTASATPYVSQGPFATASPKFGLPTPTEVAGKEYSNRLDRGGFQRSPAALTPNGLDAEQVIAWDGAGGTADALADFLVEVDYTGTRPGDTEDREVDALANKQDLLLGEVAADSSYLLFSVTGGTSGNDNIFYETPMPQSFPAGLGGPKPIADGGIWASPAQINNEATFPEDVDGLEVWAPGTIAPLEDLFNMSPGGDDSVGYNDSNRYSLEGDPDVDATGRTSVWTNTGSKFLSQAAVVTAISSLSMSGDLDHANEQAAVDVDALMILDQNDDGIFNLLDEMLFSIAPVLDADGDAGVGGLEFDGGEIFRWAAADASATFLTHGDHVWNTDFDVAGMVAGFLGVNPNDVGENINALEAVSMQVDVPEGSVPEPSTALILGGTLAIYLLRRPRNRKNRR